MAAATVAAAALRLPFLEAHSLTYDETFTREIALSGSLGDVLDGIEATEATPPLHYVLSWLWLKLTGGESDAALRVVPALAGALAAPAAYLAVRRFAGDWLGTAAAALAAFAPVLVYYSLNARAYSLLVLVSLLSLWALAGCLAPRCLAPGEEASPRGLAIWAVSAVSVLWTHYYGAFLVAAEVGALLWLLPAARRAVVAWSAAVAVAALPLVFLLAAQNDGRSDEIGRASLGERIEQTARQLAAGPNAPGPLLEGLAIALAAGGLVAGLVVARRRGVDLLALIGAAVVGAALFLSVTEIDDHFFVRNLLVAWGCFAAVTAAGLTLLRAVPLAAYLAACLAIVVVVLGDWSYRNADWRAAADEVPDGVPVLVYPGFAERVAGRYLEREPSGPIVTDRAVVVVEPGRIDRRDLVTLDDFPRDLPPGFEVVAERRGRGFRILALRAQQPAPVDPARLAPDVLGGRPVLLVP